jgi:hypothetical protein
MAGVIQLVAMANRLRKVPGGAALPGGFAHSQLARGYRSNLATQQLTLPVRL